MSLLVFLLLGAGFMQAQVKNAQSEISIDINDTVILRNAAADTLGVIDSTAIESKSWKESLAYRLGNVVEKSGLLRTSQLGIMVYDLTDNEILYSLNEKHTMRPASILKIITAVTALDALGTDYKFKTRFYCTGEKKPESRTLSGDLYVEGGMDPMLSMNDIQAFVEKLKEEGIDTIEGNLCADRSMKVPELLGEGWCWDDDNPVLSPLVFNREDNFMNELQNEIARSGIVLMGRTVNQNLPEDNTLLYVREHNINAVMKKMLKASDNLYAECMYYNLSLSKGKPAGQSGARALENALITRLGHSTSAYRIVDGSGLSLYNYVSPELMISFLRFAHRDRAIYDMLQRTLPVAGVDGTLAKRMRATVAKGKVRAKTGTLSGVNSLSGYAEAPNGHTLAFCIINQGVMRAINARNFQDIICAELCK